LPEPQQDVATSQSESQRWLRRGEYAYAQEQYEEALQYFDRALEADPKHGDALIAKGRTHQQLGVRSKEMLDAGAPQESTRLGTEKLYHLNTAIQDYDVALHLPGLTQREFTRRGGSELPLKGLLHACIGYCLGLQSQHSQAIAASQQALCEELRTAEVYNNLGFELSTQKDLLAAEEKLNQAIRLAPQLGAARHNRAMLDLMKAQRNSTFVPKRGLEDMRLALTLQPPCAELYYDAARLYSVAARHEAGYAEPALDCLELAVKYGQLAEELHRNHDLTSIMNTPRFQSLLTKSPGRQPGRRAVHLVDPAPGLLAR
jgi:tetratricopeptide (TPR) repeat protein